MRAPGTRRPGSRTRHSRAGGVAVLTSCTLGAVLLAGPSASHRAIDGSGWEARATPRRGDTTITIRAAGSALDYVPSRIAVRQGTRVRIRFVNEGTVPHNLVLVWDVDEIDELGRAAFEAAETEYVPLRYEDRMIAHSRLAAPGDTVEVEFTAPPAGEYWFVCLYAGHYNMMVGTLRVLAP